MRLQSPARFVFVLTLSWLVSIFCRFVNWEDYPERKKLATEILKTRTFTDIPGEPEQTDRTDFNAESNKIFLEFQFVPLPKTNPILIGYRWKEYHEVRYDLLCILYCQSSAHDKSPTGSRFERHR